MMYQQSKFGCKRINSSQDRFETILFITWAKQSFRKISYPWWCARLVQKLIHSVSQLWLWTQQSNFFHGTFQLVMMYHQTKFGSKRVKNYKIQQKVRFWLYEPCDLDDSKLIFFFLHNTPVYNDVLSITVSKTNHNGRGKKNMTSVSASQQHKWIIQMPQIKAWSWSLSSSPEAEACQEPKNNQTQDNNKKKEKQQKETWKETKDQQQEHQMKMRTSVFKSYSNYFPPPG